MFLMILAQSLLAAPNSDAPKPPDTRLELAGLPAVTYRSDAGLGAGLLASTARFRPGCVPFCWRALTLLQGVMQWDEQGIKVPTRNAVVFLDLPQWQRPNWRLLLALANFDDDETGYRGIGTRRIAGGTRGTPSYGWHRRVAGFKWRQRWLGRPASPTGYLDAYLGTELGWNTVTAPPGSQLQLDRSAHDRNPDSWAGLIAPYLQPSGDHLELLVSAGALYDHRDHEFTPSRGGFHEVSLRSGQAADAGLWASLFIESSFFKTLIAQRVVIASRLLLDHAVGSVPVYRRAEVGGLIPHLGVSGAEGVRGVPTYYEVGQTKAIANFELRWRVVDHVAGQQALSWRAVTFVDAGRAWTDLHSGLLEPLDLDAPWHAALVGFGGGLRLRWGQAFVLRMDAAFSPVTQTSGLYFGTDHIF